MHSFSTQLRSNGIFPFSLSMAAAIVTVPNPLPFRGISSFVLNQTLKVSQRNTFKVNAFAKKWESTKVVPQGDRVLVRLEELSEKSAGGVLLPKSAVKFEAYLMGEVLSVGTEVSEVEAGKKVIFADVNAYEVDIGEDGKHCFCKACDLLALIE